MHLDFSCIGTKKHRPPEESGKRCVRRFDKLRQMCYTETLRAYHKR